MASMSMEHIPPVNGEEVLCRFGMIADVQYADRENGFNYSRTRQRYYKDSLKHLEHAVEQWKTSGVEFVIDLGDIIDGSARLTDSMAALKTVLQIYDKLNKPVYYHWGNHEFYNFKRNHIKTIEAINSSLKPEVTKPDTDYNYYHWSPYPGFRIIFLDPFEISALGREANDPVFMETMDMLRRINKNRDLHSSRGLKGPDRRFVKFNGGVSESQLKWLDQVLTESGNLGENVVVTSHVPVYHKAASYGNSMFNSDEVLGTLHKHSCVKAYFAGHYHEGGYAVDDWGIHHITLHGVIESEPGNHTYSTLELTKNGLIVNGYGRIVDYIHIPFVS